MPLISRCCITCCVTGLPSGPSSQQGAPEGTIPDEPPFTAYLGNLPYDVEDAQLEEFFAKDCEVASVRLLRER